MRDAKQKKQSAKASPVKATKKPSKEKPLKVSIKPRRLN